MDKKELAQILEEIGVLLELKGENPFKIRAYTNAARIIEQQTEDIKDLVESGNLSKIKGIGKGLSEKITEAVTTGKMTYYKDLKISIEPGLLDMLKIPGLGPKRIKILNGKLDIASIGELEYACTENRLVELDGFGEKSQQNIIDGIRQVKKFGRYHLYNTAFNVAETIYNKLKSHKEIIRVSTAGSLRRKKEIVKDIDFIASAKDNKSVADFFASLEEVDSVIAKGETKTSIVLKSGINADLRIVSDDEYPYALHHFTGSKEHNTLLRSLAKKAGLKINEYGIFRDDKRLPCKNEKDFFKTLKLNYIPPELREGRDEIEYAAENEIPGLIERKDIRGAIHVHSTYSDG
ncbi:histidinol-phosphatase, partial [bacterium]|nr:histidinol-phosphatase [bacterium]